MTDTDEIFAALMLLRPWDIDRPKIRVGRDRDGGYVMADALRLSRHLVSAGIGRETSFDAALAARGFTIDQFDHTIEAPPEALPTATFHCQGLGPTAAEGMRTLESIVADRALGPNEAILKMDIENAEWDVLSAVDGTTLDAFSQIVMEAHRLERLGDPAYRAKVMASLENLNKNFTLFHVHANNCSKITRLNRFVTPECLEMSFIKTDLVKRSELKTIFPTDVDRPNDPKRPEYYLWMFPYIPTDQTSLSKMKRMHNYRDNMFESIRERLGFSRRKAG